MSVAPQTYDNVSKNSLQLPEMHLSNTTNDMIKLVVNHRQKLRRSMTDSPSFRELGKYRTEGDRKLSGNSNYHHK